MFPTKYGPFDGDSWEEFCQTCFKMRYVNEGYQEIVASPGDFGLEGFTTTGKAFQCYCPDHNYPTSTLYEKQRDKISEDLQKLKKYEEYLKRHLVTIKIDTWYFVTPEVRTHKLHAHCQKKAQEVQDWNLDILTQDFKVQIHDIEYYIPELSQMKQAAGEPLAFDQEIPEHNFFSDEDLDFYGKNINKKNSLRIQGTKDTEKKLENLNQITRRDLISGDDRLRNISATSPQVFHKILRIIDQYVAEVEEACLTWNGSNDELLTRLRKGLENQIDSELNLSAPDKNSIARHMVARWLAICPVSFN